ncbi:Ribosomal RNA small subunit methyltransferase G [Gammaproteobacteria bacterium]
MKSDQHEKLASILQSGLCALNLKFAQTTQEKIIKYIMLLHKWNQTYNLTAIRDPKSILIRHIFDSLATAPFIAQPNVLDFGTGAGLPGIPLALALPKYNFVLLDSSNKKTVFLNHVILSLNIENVTVVTKRIENFISALRFATIITRATTTLDAVVSNTKHLLATNGQILVMKGKYPTKELGEITQSREIYRIKVPYLDEERHLVKIC